MKRMLWMAIAATMLLMPAANAQKINDAAMRQKLAKSDADIQDAKKNVKSSTWLNRGKVYFETLQAPVNDLYYEMEPLMLKMFMGGEPVEQNGDAWVYPWVTVYLKDNKVVAWEQTRQVYDGSAKDIALEALRKAYELDPKQKNKIKSVLDAMVNYYNNVAYFNSELQHYDAAVDAYKTVFDVQSNPAYGEPNYENLYYAGYYATVVGGTDPAMYAEGEALLTKALDNGFVDANGDIYYYLFHCYYGQKDNDASKVADAQKTLFDGIMKYPKNEHILDGLIQLYTSADNVGDPADLIEIVDKALADDPENVDLWFGRGRLFYKLNNLDECIASFKRAIEIKPDTFEGNYFLGVAYTVKGDRLLNEMSTHDFKSQSEYDAELNRALDVYKAAVPYYEKALGFDPQHADTIETLKAVCFRLRDSGDEYMPKFEKYSAMYKQLNGLE